MTAGCSMLAITRSFPPHCRQVSISMANTRLSRCAQLIARCRSTADGSLDSIALPAADARVFSTIRTRSGLAGANTPWYRVRCAALPGYSRNLKWLRISRWFLAHTDRSIPNLRNSSRCEGTPFSILLR